MSRKTAYENEHKTLQKKQGNNKDTKKRAWQYLFEHQGQLFSATQVANALGDVHRTTVRDALNDLLDHDPIVERKKAYKVYKQDTYYYILDVESHEKKKTTKKERTNFEYSIDHEAYELSKKPHICSATQAEDLHAEVIFYPINKKHFEAVKSSLTKLFSEYLIAIFEGNRKRKNGLFIIIKPHNDVNKTKEHIKNLYAEVVSKKEKSK